MENTKIDNILCNMCDCFRFSAAKEGNNRYGAFWFLVDNTQVAIVEEWDADDTTSQGTGTIMLELTAGQLVRIENEISTFIYGTSSTGYLRSWFTGFLLYALK